MPTGARPDTYTNMQDGLASFEWINECPIWRDILFSPILCGGWNSEALWCQTFKKRCKVRICVWKITTFKCKQPFKMFKAPSSSQGQEKGGVKVIAPTDRSRRLGVVALQSVWERDSQDCVLHGHVWALTGLLEYFRDGGPGGLDHLQKGAPSIQIWDDTGTVKYPWMKNKPLWLN